MAATSSLALKSWMSRISVTPSTWRAACAISAAASGSLLAAQLAPQRVVSTSTPCISAGAAQHLLRAPFELVEDRGGIAAQLGGQPRMGGNGVARFPARQRAHIDAGLARAVPRQREQILRRHAGRQQGVPADLRRDRGMRALAVKCCVDLDAGENVPIARR